MPANFKDRVLAAEDLLHADSINFQKFESLRKLIEGIDPRLDKLLLASGSALSKIDKIQKGDIIALSADLLSETNEDEKERKRKVIAFLKFWNDLKSEVDRIKNELDSGQSSGSQASNIGRMAAYAKGPFGLVTIAAILILGGFALISSMKGQNKVVDLPHASSSPASDQKAKYIVYEAKKIPFEELTVGVGPECDQAEHYHAKDHTRVTLSDGSRMQDPGNCGFGKVSEAEVLEE